MEERKIIELPTKSQVNLSDQFVIEDEDGTKLGDIVGLKKLITKNTIFNSVEDMKASSFKEGEVCNTLGYYSPGDGGGATYRITYSPALNEDKALVHYLYTSDTLRAEFVLQDTVSPEQFGARGDGIKDDYLPIKKCIDSGFPIHFNTNKKYLIKTSIPLSSNLYLDMNGCTIVPSYCNGFAKLYNSAESASLSNVVLKNFKLDLKNGSNGIEISHRAINITMENFEIYNTKLYGIKLGQTEAVRIVNGSIRANSDVNSAVGIGISDTNYSGKLLDFSIDKVYLKNLTPAIMVQNTTTSVVDRIGITNCNFERTEMAIETFANAIRVNGGSVYMSLSDCTMDKLDSAIVFQPSVEGSLSIKDIYANEVESLIDNLNASSVITLEGSVKLQGSSSAAKKPVIKRLYGTLQLATSDISYPATRHVAYSSTKNDYTGTVRDMVDPKSHDKINATGSNTINIGTLTNMNIDIKTTANITTIAGGINGQRLCLKSSSNRSIISSSNILLDHTPYALTTYNGIELIHDNGKWYQN